MKQELVELNQKHSLTLDQNRKLMEQLKLFEKESFEI